MKKFCLLVITLTLGAKALAAPLPQQDDYTHMGVPTCASSTCHGKINAQDGEPVQLNEYHLWSTEDFHSRAFQVLRNEESRQMAEALGLANARNADICLDCHADNVPSQRRGEKFQLSDGVSCEACHGGAENWLESHTEPEATHQSNLDEGLYPLSDPIARADLCLSCHMGTRDKFATHAIMAAGHPRLSFELDTFTANQPAHYQVDDDYIERKADHPLGYLWVVGQLEAAQRQLTLIEEHHFGKSVEDGMLELSIYDCHSCHRDLQSRRGRPADFSADSPVGGLRLLDHSFDMVAVVVEVLRPNSYDDYGEAVARLHGSHNRPDAIESAVDNLRNRLEALGDRVASQPPSPEAVASMRREIARRSARGTYADYSSAEQAFLALEALSFALDDRAALKEPLDQLFASLGDETAFDPQAFSRAGEGFLAELP